MPEEMPPTEQREAEGLPPERVGDLLQFAGDIINRAAADPQVAQRVVGYVMGAVNERLNPWNHKLDRFSSQGSPLTHTNWRAYTAGTEPPPTNPNSLIGRKITDNFGQLPSEPPAQPPDREAPPAPPVAPPSQT